MAEQDRVQVEDAIAARIQGDDQWVRVQRKTFTRWCNVFLSEREMEIEDLTTDFADGVLLINLLEEISGKSVGRYNKKPRIRAQNLENLLLAFKFLKEENVTLVSVGPEDIADGQQKLILGLIWTLILRFQINRSGRGNAKNELLEWVRRKIPEYDINNFSSDWTDGRAISALAEAVNPTGYIDLEKQLSEDPVRNASLGFGKATKEMDIPQILDPEDMVCNPNDHANMTYISLFRDWEDRRRAEMDAEERERMAEPGRCIAYGPGLESAEAQIPTEFTIEARNEFDRRCPCGGFKFKVIMKDPSGGTVPVTVSDEGNGLFPATYEPKMSGLHTIAITLEGKHIIGSVFNVLVKDEVVDATRCRAYGPGIETGEAGVPSTFFIECCNRLGNRISNPKNVSFDVVVEAPYDRTIQSDKPFKTDTGVFKSGYVPLDPGVHKVHVLMNGDQPIADSPYIVDVGMSTIGATALNSYAEGPGLESGRSVVNPAIYTIHAVGCHGTPVILNTNPFDSLISGPDGRVVPSTVVNNNDGTFTVTYHPNDAGDYVVSSILRHNILPLYYDDIKNSPVTVSFIAAADTGLSYAYGPGLEDGLRDTEPGEFKIQAVNKNGEPMKQGGDDFTVRVIDPEGRDLPVELKDNDDGTYDVVYSPEGPGQHRVEVNLRGSPIKNAPYSVTVVPGTLGRFCVVENYSFTIEAKTKRNEAQAIGGDVFEVVVVHVPSGRKVDATVRDNSDGTYLVSYKLRERGEYEVSVVFDGEHISGSPWKQSR